MNIISLWRYPVKSMLGEEITEAAVTARGFAGDRAYALQDADTGHIASAKHPRKWGVLLQCRARYLGTPQPDAPLPPVEITLPDGRTVRSDDADVDEVLSVLTGRRVRLLAAAPETPTREANRADADVVWETEDIKQEPMGSATPHGTFVDFAPMHLLTTHTLASLSRLAPDSTFDVRRFRPNIVIEAAPSPADDAANAFPEFAWLGRTLTTANAALYLTDPCPRCVITTLAHGSLTPDLGVLKTIARHTSAPSVTAAPGHTFPAVVGVYAQAVSDGVLRVGDMVSPTNES